MENLVMKKRMILVAALTLCLTGVAMAQNEKADADVRPKMRAEMAQKRAERFADEFKLDGTTKTEFISLYKRYMDEISGTMSLPDSEQKAEVDEKKKELTDEEATAKIQANFERQEEQITKMHARLQSQKKYYAEFSRFLTPQQLLKIFSQPRRMGMPHNGNMRQGGRPGGFGPRQNGIGGGPDNFGGF